MRIALLAREAGPGSAWGGIGSYTWASAHGLVALGHDVTVFAAPAEPGQDSDRVVGEVRVVQTSNRWQAPSRLVRSGLARQQLEAAVEADRAVGAVGADFDVIEGPEWLAEGWRVARRRRGHALMVTHLHGGVRGFLRSDPSWRNRSERLASWIEGRAVAASGLVTACVPGAARDAAGTPLFPQSPRLFPMPLDLTSWTSVAPQTGRATLVVAGSLLPRKAPDLLVRAAGMLVRSGLDLQVTVIGKSFDGGETRAGLVALAQDLGVPIEVLPATDQVGMQGIYSSSTVVILPSWYETFGLVAAEAMAVGRPVVVSDGCGVADTVRACAGGTVFSRGDPIALAAALEPYLKEPSLAAQAGARAAAYVATAHDPIESARVRCAIYDSALSTSR